MARFDKFCDVECKKIDSPIADIECAAKIVAMLRRTQIAIALAALSLASCSADTHILGDYTIYDLGGSNQGLIGAGGKIGLSNVTGYATAPLTIYVEIGPEGEGFKNSTKGCSYRSIDVSKNSMSVLEPETVASRAAAAAIRLQQKGLVSRSCSRP